MDPLPYYQATLLCLVPFFHHLHEFVGEPGNTLLRDQAFTDWMLYAWGGLLGVTPRTDPALAWRELGIAPMLDLTNQDARAQLTTRERVQLIARAHGGVRGRD